MKHANLQVTRNLGRRIRRFRRRLASNPFALAVPQFYTSSIQTPVDPPVEETHQMIGVGQFLVKVIPAVGLAVRRARIAIDLTIAGQRFGLHAEALLTVRRPITG
jgi:hypothetical protein